MLHRANVQLRNFLKLEALKDNNIRRFPERRRAAAAGLCPPVPRTAVLIPRTDDGRGCTTRDAGRSACLLGFDHYPFCDTSLPLDARVHDLVKRIPDAAKPNLLTARGSGKGAKYAATAGREAFPELGAPSYYWGSNCLHSSMLANCTDYGHCSTSFPSAPSWAAMFDRDLWPKKMATVVGRGDPRWLQSAELHRQWPQRHGARLLGPRPEHESRPR